MKQTLLSVFILVCSTICNAQVQFSCSQIVEDNQKWNELASNYKNDNVKWANGIKDTGTYKLNADGSLEYVYIIEATDTVDTTLLRERTFDYICFYFNMDNESRANMVTNSEGDGVFFNGKFLDIGEFVGFGETNHIHADMTFNIKFKPNRIRFSLKIEKYQVLKIGTKGEIYQNRNVYLSSTYPLNQESDHKKSYAMAFINGNSRCISYAIKYVMYLNQHFSETTKAEEDEW